MNDSHQPSELLDAFELTEYEEQALQSLIELGRSTAPSLSEATGIPKARVYGVLDGLSDEGFIKIIPGRPKEYEAKPPAELLDQAIENERQEYASFKKQIEDIEEEFVETLMPIYERGRDEISTTEELFHVVDVGEPSERETRSIYRDATNCVHIITKSFEYFDAVEPAVTDALKRGCEIRVLFLDPELLDESNQTDQQRMRQHLNSSYPTIEYRFSAKRLPWRGTVVDPSLSYDSGAAVLLVEEEDIPLHNRQAAITNNASFVAGLERYFDLIWQYDTVDDHADP
ncbi:TrmB family transcriptional regulator [Haloquadratum walsbyi]|uniref:Putative transcriptional regulator n=1 Tax=Haloquadratum walsbyi J07HQW2 TaxID=1238425 RepID=U1PNA1_9EURY|nr:helix-turn-helix domain-containing protein [Haloquadratum walsbyi]ERG95222.1 MAG: putative transcriptional regulator [Haloquadratum walsbyi J07HQW2]